MPRSDEIRSHSSLGIRLPLVSALFMFISESPIIVVAETHSDLFISE